MKLKSVMFLILTAALAVSLAACGGSSSTSRPGGSGGDKSTASGSGEKPAAPIKARLAHSGASESNLDLLVKDFAKAVKEKTDGRLDITVYPAGQLYNDVDTPAAVTTGSVELGLNSSTLWADAAPSVEVFSIPALYPTSEQVHQALDGEIGDIIKDEMRAAGAEQIAWIDYSYVYFASKKVPLTSKENWKNKSVRASNSANAEWIKAMGAVPVTMPGPDVIEALSRGTIDGALSGVDSFAKRKYYDFAKYYSGPVYFSMFLVTANKAWYDGLPDDLKQIMMEAAKETEQKSAQQLAENQEAAHKEVQEHGMKLAELTAEDKAAWKEASQSLLDKWLQKAGENGKRILELSKGE